MIWESKLWADNFSRSGIYLRFATIQFEDIIYDQWAMFSNSLENA